MGIVQKEALRTTIVSYIGLILGYVNKGVLFVILLSVEEVGLINLILAVGVLFAQLANLGVINTSWRLFPFLKNENNNHYGFLTLNFLIVFIGIAIFSLVAVSFKDTISQFYASKSAAFIDYYYWIIPCGIGIVLYKFLDGYLRALYKNVFSVIVNDFILRVVTSLLLLAYGVGIFEFDELLISICISQFIPPLLLIFYLRKIREWHFSVKEITIPRRMRKIIFSFSLFTYTNSLGALMVTTIDAMMVASMVGLASTGVYTTMIYLIRALMIPYASISRVSAPLVATHWKNRDMTAMRELYRKVSSVNLVIGLLLFLGVWSNRFELFGFLPEEYASGMYVFLYLMIGRLFDMYFGLNGSILVTSKKYRYDIIFTVSLFVIVIALNLIFIPRWGVYGAAISTSIAVAAYNVARLLYVWKRFHLHPFHRSQFFVLILSCISYGIVEYLIPDTGNVWLNMTVKSLTVLVTFPLLIYVFKIEKETVGYVNKILKVLKGKLS